MLGRAAAEVERQVAALDDGPQRQLKIAARPLEDVPRSARAPVEFAQAGTCAPLAVVQYLARRGAQRRGAHAFGERAHPQGTDGICRELCAQIGATLVRLSHPAGQPLDGGLVEDLRVDHHTLFGERVAVGRHRARPSRPHVGVMRPAGREADE